ncbi:hypothetical protein EV1_004342 [Malus domestica]
MLLLDSSHNVHSIVYKDQKWTASYWICDEFASLPAIVPKGPIAILGLDGGTAAHLMLILGPSLQLEGWEIDQIFIDKAREYLGLSDLEKQTQAGGILNVHIGNALSPSVNIPGGYAGEILVYMARCITRSTFFCFFGCCAQIQGFVCNFCTRAYFPSTYIVYASFFAIPYSSVPSVLLTCSCNSLHFLRIAIWILETHRECYPLEQPYSEFH